MRTIIIAITILAGGVMLLASTTVGALTVNTSTRQMTLFRENLNSDPDVVISLQGYINQGGNRNANATTCPGREATGSNPIIRDDLSAGNKVYGGLIQETFGSSWPARTIYRVEVFGDGNLLTTVYFRNNNANDNQVEGVRFRADLGSANPPFLSYSTIVTKLNACS